MKGNYVMKFCDKKIQEELSKGGKVCHKSWKNNKWLKYIYMDKKDKTIKGNGGSRYSINYWDLNNDDWEIFEDNNEKKYNQKKIIDEHILCLFWDDDIAHDLTHFRIGRLLGINYAGNTWKYSAEVVVINGYKKITYIESFAHYKPIELKDYNLMNNEQDYLK